MTRLHYCNNYVHSLPGGTCPYQELASPAGREASVTHMAFSIDAQYVVLCRGTQALVYSSKVRIVLIHNIILALGL